MKLKLTIFLISLFIATLGIGVFASSAFQTRVPLYESRRAILTHTPDAYVYKNNIVAGIGSSLATLGIGAGIGVPIILRKRST